jgi:hypothetical protein
VELPQGERDPACPVCSGVLVPLRGLYRCSRCSFSLCVGCEAEESIFSGPSE